MTFPWSQSPLLLLVPRRLQPLRLGRRRALYLGEEGELHSFQESYEVVNAQKIQEQMFLVQLGKEDGCSWPKQALSVLAGSFHQVSLPLKNEGLRCVFLIVWTPLWPPPPWELERWALPTPSTAPSGTLGWAGGWWGQGGPVRAWGWL